MINLQNVDQAKEDVQECELRSRRGTVEANLSAGVIVIKAASVHVRIRTSQL